MSFRIEEKIPLSRFDSQIFLKKLKSLGANTLYKDRKIFSTYFETYNLKCYQDSEEGVLPRKKIRIRKYLNENNSDFFLETKISSFEGRFKISKKITKEYADSLLKFGYLDSTYGNIIPILNIEYDRSYLVLEKSRITFDKNIIYNNFKSSNTTKSDLNVFEIKQSVSEHNIFQILNEVSRKRFSKYCEAVNLLNIKINY